ncbi:phage tail family protein [Bacillus subtilis]|uniref:phage tail family protein n=1 Tax=Bacillus subtilis TaxID=1423 RepID=UPI002149E52E|nr:phage tail family protein [Bacillus subtilis]MCR1994590.1 phage tail family protein [Bacillus subtilis]
MDVEITKLNGESFRLSEYDVTARDFVAGSPTINPVYSQIEGRHGRVDMGATYDTRSISVPFYYKAADIHDVALLRDELAGLAVSAEPFYIREMRRIIYGNGDNQFISGKRYKVRLANSYEIDQQLEFGSGELRFETTDLPFAESIGTTADIDANGIDVGSAIWGAGMGLSTEPDYQRYTWRGTSAVIYNAGKIAVHPFMQYLKITISDVRGSTQFLQLRNATNGSIFRVNEAVSNSDTIVIDGPNVTKNGLVFFRKTSREFISLEPGRNDIQITGATSAKVSFDFRFYYL